MEATMNEWEYACPNCKWNHDEEDACPIECDDCGAPTIITIKPYGSGKMAVIYCRNCRQESYDTNLDETEAGE